MTAKLTLGIPTLDRPEFLRTCLRSIAAQTEPVHVVIGDQGWRRSTKAVLDEFRDTLDIERRRTRATGLWDNWARTAIGCETPYFAWVQDDDVLSPHYARRIVTGLDSHELCVAWLAVLKMSYNTEGYSCWWEGNGPPIPMDFLNFGVAEVNGDLLMAIAPFTSAALSPAIAFRVGDGFDDMLRAIPPDCDLFHERMHVAEWARGKHILCDPWTAGYWVMHEGNTSKVLNRDKALRRRQTRVFMRWLGPRLESFDWVDMLKSWCVLVSPNTAACMLKTLREHGPYKICRQAIRAIQEVRPGLKPRPLEALG